MTRLLLFVAVILLGVGSLSAQSKLVVHEWGTFSTFSGSDGKLLKFAPNDTDLPQFVHNNRRMIKGGPADCLVSLETPVLYFYSDREQSVSVHVNFQRGAITDWFPDASRRPLEQIRWDNLKIRPKADPKMPTERSPSRYYAAREVPDANPVTMTIDAGEGKTREESDKFLFYRGVGDFELPFRFSAKTASDLTIENQSYPISACFAIQIGEQIRFKNVGKVEAREKKDIRIPGPKVTPEFVMEEMTKALVADGLTVAEAKAMVKTWQQDWFKDPGTRILYLLDLNTTDALLPMTITPKPDKLVRVLVGRHDILPPEREKEIEELVKRVNGPSNEDAKKAEIILNQYGRYRYAAQKEAQKRLDRPKP